MPNFLTDILYAVAGGILIGLSAGLFMIARHRILGISGIAARFYASADNILLLVGMPIGLAIYLLLRPTPVSVTLSHSPLLLTAAGLLVGFGARLGNGCTSGHAVCGLARLSPRSLAATGLFMASAMVTVALGHLS